MSGLYNMLFGTNPAIGLLLGFLGIFKDTADKWPLGRLRDAYTNEEGTRIFIFTRNGGLDESESAKIENNFRDNHPHFVASHIDSFDSTYVTYEFGVPAEYTFAVHEIAQVTDTMPPMERMSKLLSDLHSGKDNELTKNAKEVGEKIFGAIQRGESGSIQHGDGSVDVDHFHPPKQDDC